MFGFRHVIIWPSWRGHREPAWIASHAGAEPVRLRAYGLEHLADARSFLRCFNGLSSGYEVFQHEKAELLIGSVGHVCPRRRPAWILPNSPNPYV